VDGEGAAEVVYRVLQGIIEGRALEEIRESFADIDRDAVDRLVDELVDRCFLTSDDCVLQEPLEESPLDVFYWNFGLRAERASQALERAQLTVLGVNEVSRRLMQILRQSGVDNTRVVDYQLLRNIGLFDNEGQLLDQSWEGERPVAYKEWASAIDFEYAHCVVATSDFGWTPAIREWNRTCIESGWLFFPVVLHDLTGFAGPLVVPGETACYECLRARQNSHLDDPVKSRGPEEQAFAAQRVRGFHPAMAGVLGDLAAMELTKFYAGLPLARAGTIVEINLLAPSLIRRPVLKVPRCSVCSSLRRRVRGSLDMSIYRLNE
jgi:bacteriocin biosynthesis cyclodehydratase domain-containing protein